jgi:acyl-CoA thioesterase
MQISRLTVDLKRPVPMGELDISIDITREGRNIQTVDVTLISGGKEVVRAAALRIREADFDTPAEVAPPAEVYPRSEEREQMNRFKGFNEGISVHNAIGAPAHMRRAAWFHISRPFFADQPTTPIMRAATTGDYCNGFGSGLDFTRWTFINADLTLHFARRPVGEWIMLTANAWIDGNGSGLGYGELADEKGFFGRAVQSLVIGKR